MTIKEAMEELYIDFKESEAYFLNETANITFNFPLVIEKYALLGNIGIYNILNVRRRRKKGRTISILESIWLLQNCFSGDN